MSAPSSLSMGLWSALLAACLSAPAQATPPYAVDTTPVSPTTFRYRFADGETRAYRVEFALQASRSSLTVNSDESATINGSATLTRVTQQVARGGNGFLFERLTDLSVDYRVQGNPVPVDDSSSADSLIRRIEITPRGFIEDEELTPQVSLPSSLPHLTRLDDLWDWSRVELPEEPITIGTTWPQLYRYHLTGTPLDESNVNTATHTFAGFAEVDGRRCAVITTELEMVIELPTGQEFETNLPVLGRGTGIGTYYFDVDQGQLVHGDIAFGFVAQTTQTTAPVDYTNTLQVQFTLRP